MKYARNNRIARLGDRFSQIVGINEGMSRIPDFNPIRVSNNVDRRVCPVVPVHDGVHDGLSEYLQRD